MNMITETPNPIVTLTTDFGWTEYIAAMKAVILNINPNVNIIDITHAIHPQNTIEGAYVLYSAAPYFKNAIHIAVVDPGVGTDRKGLIINCENGILIGPDNGSMLPAAKRLNIIDVYEITNTEYCLDTISDTFHGRDIFAPVAAHISKGIEPGEIGQKLQDYQVIDLEDFTETATGIHGKVLYIDNFGNIITNIPQDVMKRGFEFGDIIKLAIPNHSLELIFTKTYGLAEKGQLIGLISSSGFFELGANLGNAVKILGIKVNDEIIINF